MSEFRVIVTGSRDWPRGLILPDVLRRVGDAAWLDHDRVVLAHGGCPDGADAEADELWTSWGWPTDPVPAAWGECGPECAGLPPAHRRTGRRGPYCPGAGMRRNAALVGRGGDVGLAFVLPSSRGTWNCVRLMRRAGIPVWAYKPDGSWRSWPKPVLPPEPLW